MVPVFPGQTAKPFADFREKILEVSPAQQAAIMGRGNLALVESGVVKWSDVVTSGRIRSLREVVSRGGLTVDQMVRAGVQESHALEAYNAVHTGTHTATEKRRKELTDALLAKGYSSSQISSAAGKAVAYRVTTSRPPDVGPPPAPPSPVPSPTPKPQPAPAAKASAPAVIPTPARLDGPHSFTDAFLRVIKRFGLRIFPPKSKGDDR